MTVSRPHSGAPLAEHPGVPPSVLGLGPDTVGDLLEAAGRAPSLHNSQPWAFRLRSDRIEVLADPTRTLPAADPEDRELRLAVGAAVLNLTLALSDAGVRPVVTVLPDRAQPTLLAVVRHGGAETPGPQVPELLAAVRSWATNRAPFTDAPVSEPDRNAMQRAALQDNGWLTVVEDHEQRRAVAELAATAHRTQQADPAWVEEMARWVAAAPSRADGVPATAGGPAADPGERWARRDFSGGTARARAAGTHYEERPVIAVLSSHLSGRSADVRAGMAMQRVLLTATSRGLAVSFFSQLVEVPEVRETLRRTLSLSRPPQAVLRVGHGTPVPTTPRRRIGDLLVAPSAQD